MKKQIIFTTIALTFVIQAQDYHPPTYLISLSDEKFEIESNTFLTSG